MAWALTPLPNGDVVAGWYFTAAGGATANYIARWNGASWSTFGSGTDNAVTALTTMSNGDVLAGGDFLIAGGILSAYLAQLTTTCHASAASAGTGCVGSGGSNVLTAVALPWIGGTFVSRATGVAPNSLALGVRGLGTASIPMPTILPQGLAGARCLSLRTCSTTTCRRPAP